MSSTIPPGTEIIGKQQETRGQAQTPVATTDPALRAARLRVLLFSLAMVVLASICNAAMDKISFHFDASIFASPALAPYRTWLDPRLSWRNKWRNAERPQGEAFPLSSTALVGITDAWHCLKTLTKAALILALMAPFTLLYRLPSAAWAGVFIAGHVLSGAVFELFFGVLFST